MQRRETAKSHKEGESNVSRDKATQAHWVLDNLPMKENEQPKNGCVNDVL